MAPVLPLLGGAALGAAASAAALLSSSKAAEEQAAQALAAVQASAQELQRRLDQLRGEEAAGQERETALKQQLSLATQASLIEMEGCFGLACCPVLGAAGYPATLTSLTRCLLRCCRPPRIRSAVWRSWMLSCPACTRLLQT